MAMARCEEHGKPKGPNVKNNYVLPCKPVGYPDTAAICGRAHCDKPAIVWLNDEEAENYEKGDRVFYVNTFSMKVRVE